MVPHSLPSVTVLRAQIGTLIRTHRKARKLRLIDVALRTGFSLPKLCRLEFGRERIGYTELHTLAGAFGVPVTSLLPTHVRVRKIPRLEFGPGVYE